MPCPDPERAQQWAYKHSCTTLIDGLGQVAWSETLPVSWVQTQPFQENCHFIFWVLVTLKLLMSLISRIVACSARIIVDTHTHTQDKYHNPRYACMPRVNYGNKFKIGHQQREKLVALTTIHCKNNSESIHPELLLAYRETSGTSNMTHQEMILKKLPLEAMQYLLPKHNAEGLCALKFLWLVHIHASEFSGQLLSGMQYSTEDSWHNHSCQGRRMSSRSSIGSPFITVQTLPVLSSSLVTVGRLQRH